MPSHIHTPVISQQERERADRVAAASSSPPHTASAMHYLDVDRSYVLVLEQ